MKTIVDNIIIHHMNNQEQNKILNQVIIWTLLTLTRRCRRGLLQRLERKGIGSM